MVKKFFSRKHTKVLALSTLVELMNKNSKTKDKLMIHTANGIYIGELVESPKYDNFELTPDDTPLNSFNKLYLSTVEKFQKDKLSSDITEIDENSLSIQLKDVKLINDSTTITMPFIEIFIDQVIGFSYGSISQ